MIEILTMPPPSDESEESKKSVEVLFDSLQSGFLAPRDILRLLQAVATSTLSTAIKKSRAALLAKHVTVHAVENVAENLERSVGHEDVKFLLQIVSRLLPHVFAELLQSMSKTLQSYLAGVEAVRKQFQTRGFGHALTDSSGLLEELVPVATADIDKILIQFADDPAAVITSLQLHARGREFAKHPIFEPKPVTVSGFGGRRTARIRVHRFSSFLPGDDEDDAGESLLDREIRLLFTDLVELEWEKDDTINETAVQAFVDGHKDTVTYPALKIAEKTTENLATADEDNPTRQLHFIAIKILMQAALHDLVVLVEETATKLDDFERQQDHVLFLLNEGMSDHVHDKYGGFPVADYLVTFGGPKTDKILLINHGRPQDVQAALRAAIEAGKRHEDWTDLGEDLSAYKELGGRRRRFTLVPRHAKSRP